MNPMIDRVARAIAAQQQINGNPDVIVGHGDLAHFYWVEFVDHAVAAIEAMMEPTEAMDDAGFQEGSIGDGQWDYAAPTPTYKAMIKAALEECK